MIDTAAALMIALIQQLYEVERAAADVFFDANRDLTLRGTRLSTVLATDLPFEARFRAVDPLVDPQLIGIQANGSVWRNSFIAPDIRVNPVRAGYVGIAYVVGFDRTDSNRYKLFGVNVVTGEVLRAIPLSGICEQRCGVVVDSSGNLYVNEIGAAAPIFRVSYPF